MFITLVSLSRLLRDVQIVSLFASCSVSSDYVFYVMCVLSDGCFLGSLELHPVLHGALGGSEPGEPNQVRPLECRSLRAGLRRLMGRGEPCGALGVKRVGLGIPGSSCVPLFPPMDDTHSPRR